MNLYPLTPLEQEYLSHIQDLMAHDKVRSMRRYTQHGDTSCLEHSLQVSFTSFRMARRLGLDAAAAALGASSMTSSSMTGMRRRRTADDRGFMPLPILKQPLPTPGSTSLCAGRKRISL